MNPCLFSMLKLIYLFVLQTQLCFESIMDKHVQLGKQLGHDKQEPRDLIKEQQYIEREERVAQSKDKGGHRMGCPKGGR